jgi:hypothetical protein
MSTAKVAAHFAFVMILEIVQNFLALTDILCLLKKIPRSRYHLSLKLDQKGKTSTKTSILWNAHSILDEANLIIKYITLKKIVYFLNGRIATLLTKKRHNHQIFPHIIIRYEKNSGHYIHTCALCITCSVSRVHAIRNDNGITNTNNGSNNCPSDPSANITCRFFNTRTNTDPAFILGY